MKRVLKPFLFILFGIVLGWFFRGFARPDYPESWDEIELGMSESEVFEIVPALAGSRMRELKGFDGVSVDFGDRYWSLLITYDESLAVNSIQKNYVDRNLGFMRKRLREAVE